MHPGYYHSGTLSPSQQVASLRQAHANSTGSASRMRPSYLQVDVTAYGAPHMASPTFANSPHHFLMSPHFPLNSPVGSSTGNMVPRPPPVLTGAHDAVINEQTIRSLQERVTQLASIPRMTMQDLVSMQAQHITPRSMAQEGMRSAYMSDITHLNPPGSVRPPFMGGPQPKYSNSKHQHVMGSSASFSPELLHGGLTPMAQGAPTPSSDLFLAMPPPPTKGSPHGSMRYIGPTEEELRKLNELMPRPDDPDSKKSVEEWKKFRLRVMSRLRKQRWRAKKKAEVLAGDEATQREEAERKRRDRLRKQEQRAKKKMRSLGDGSSYGDMSSSAGASPSASASGDRREDDDDEDDDDEEEEEAEEKPSKSAPAASAAAPSSSSAAASSSDPAEE